MAEIRSQFQYDNGKMVNMWYGIKSGMKEVVYLFGYKTNHRPETGQRYGVVSTQRHVQAGKRRLFFNTSRK